MARKGRCKCPRGSKRISTRGHGRGFVCQAKKRKRTPRAIRNIGPYYKPFVRMSCK